MSAEIGTKIREARTAAGMSQAKLAETTGMNRSMLGRLEAMDYTPSFSQLERLGEVLGFDPTEVFSEPAEEIRVRLLELVDADARAFLALSGAYALPKTDAARSGSRGAGAS